MTTREFLLYERQIIPYPPNDFSWLINSNKNLEGYEGARHAFTWQPHGSQFTIKDLIPAGATRFKISREPKKISMKQVIDLSEFEPSWVEIL